MQFAQIIGQEEVKKKLVQLVQNNRLSHALLFLGKEGSGDLALAIAFAQYIVCTSAKEYSKPAEASLFDAFLPEKTEIEVDAPKVLQMDSCGVCSACLKAGKLVHPDIHFSYPIVPRKPADKPVCTDYINDWREFVSGYPYGIAFDWLQFIGAENKQGNIPVKECEDIGHKISLKSFESNYKILIMWMPEYLGKEGNKLLKLIEEPPPNTIFLLVARDEKNIIPTILSRTQLIRIPALDDESVERALIERANVPEQKAKQITAMAAGNYREALQLIQYEEQDWLENARDWLKCINRQQIAEQLKWIDDISKLGREKQKQFLIYFISLFEQAIRLGAIDEISDENGTGLVLNMSDAERDFGTRLNKLCSFEAQEAIITELNHACYYIERNANAKLLFHSLTIRLYHIIKDNSLILVN